MKRLSIATLALLSFAVPAAADPVTPATSPYSGYENHSVYVFDNGEHVSDGASGALPDSATYSASAGGSSITASHARQYDAGGAILRTDVEFHNRDTENYYIENRAAGSFYFDVTEEVSYNLVGQLLGQGNNDESHYDYWEFNVRLFQYDGAQSTEDGESVNMQVANSGVLATGTYHLYYSIYVLDNDTYNVGTTNVTGSGFVQLTLGNPQINAVPEPGTWALVALGGLALLGGARRKK